MTIWSPFFSKINSTNNIIINNIKLRGEGRRQINHHHVMRSYPRDITLLYHSDVCRLTWYQWWLSWFGSRAHVQQWKVNSFLCLPASFSFVHLGGVLPEGRSRSVMPGHRVNRLAALCCCLKGDRAPFRFVGVMFHARSSKQFLHPLCPDSSPPHPSGISEHQISHLDVV